MKSGFRHHAITIPKQVLKIVRLHPSAYLFVALILSLPHGLWGQNAPDNVPNSLSPIGIPPLASTEGANEQLVLSTGNLSVSLPVLKLKQRGGWDLNLGYIYNSNISHHVQMISVNNTIYDQDGENADGRGQATSLGYSEQYIIDHQPLEPNLPRLQASTEYFGSYGQDGDTTNTQPKIANFCVTNFIFTDWAGSSHSFSTVSSCSDKNYTGEQRLLVTKADSLDGSFYSIDTSDSNHAVVTAKDGTTYTFNGTWDSYSTIPQGQSAGDNTNTENSYDDRSMTMSDPNGNTISVVNQPGGTTLNQTWKLTDTLGRTVSIGSQGITYLDSNSNSSNVTITSGPGTPLSSPLTFGAMSCADENSNVGQFETTELEPNGYPQGQTSSSTTQLTVTLPASDANGNHRTYKLLYDPDGHLIQIVYPTGGYTRYDYANDPVPSWNANIQCSVERFHVTAKHVCSDPSGNCQAAGTEQTTLYQGTNTHSPSVQGEDVFFGMMLVTDPLGTEVQHSFSVNGTDTPNDDDETIPNPPLERDVITSDASGKTLKTVHSVYQCWLSRPNICYPSTVTTTLNDSPSGASSRVVYQYKDLVTIGGYSEQAGPAALDHPNQTDTYDFNGVHLASVVSAYEPASAFTVPHVWDKVHSTTTTDSVTSQVATVTYAHDTLGNVSSATTTAGDITTMATQYGPYTNGYPAWEQDGRGNRTTFSYTNAFTGGSCASTAPSGAYLTLVTLPDGSSTSFQYNACTGSVASVTDTNNTVTTYVYDSLGRQTAASKPGAFASMTQYSDAGPNSITTTTKATPNPDVISVAVMDGLGRTVSSTQGDTETDTTYDTVGRVFAVSEPKIVGDAGTASTVNTYDALDRVTKITHPDGGVTSTDYFGEMSVLRDPVGSTHVVTLNSQGQTTAVCEVAPAMTASGESPATCPALLNEGNLQGYTTQYDYDGRGNLQSVTAHGQSRTFSYDSLSRLTQSDNPESGTVCYGSASSNGCSGGYDANGNLVSKTDARGITTSYQYDMLNRLISKSFSDRTPSQCFSYAPGSSSSVANGNGRLILEWTQAGSCSGSTGLASAITKRTVLAYDAAGRVTQEQQCAFGACSGSTGTMQYSYDLAGARTSSTNGITSSPGIQFNYWADLSHRPLSVTSSWDDATHPATLFSADPNVLGKATYGPYGLVAARFGIPSQQQIGVLSDSRQYDSMGRILLHTVESGGGSSGSTPPPASDTTISLNPNPVAAGVTAIGNATCQSCKTGTGEVYIDGNPAGGFSYNPGDVQNPGIGPFANVGTHNFQVIWTDSDSTVHQTPVFSFPVVAANSIPTPKLNATISPTIVPTGESGELNITLDCTTSCGEAQGTYTVDGNFAGGFTTDENGTAMTYTSNAFGVGKHTLVVSWFGNGNYNSAQYTTTLDIENQGLAEGTLNISVSPWIGNPAGDTVDIPANAWSTVSISDICQSACGTGQYFVDGNFYGGFGFDDSGSVFDGVLLYPSSILSVGTHKLTVEYAGNSSWGPSTASLSFNVVANNLPVPSLQPTIVSPPVQAQTWSQLQLTISAQGVTSCGGQGQILVDGQYSDTFFVGDDGTVTGNTGQYELLRPMPSGSHSYTVSYWGSTACAPTASSFSYTIQ